jgi:adenylate kinase
MLRETVKEGTELGKNIEEYMVTVDLVPDEIVTKSVIERMGKDDAQQGVILDGYPRTKNQAISLDQALKAAGKKLDVVLYFKTSEDVAVQRLTGRRVCPECGKNYHITNMPPAKEGICDLCGVQLIQRKDDNIETVKNRFNVYQERTKDLIDYYTEQGLLKEVDGDLSAEKLFGEISGLFREEGLVNDSSN